VRRMRVRIDFNESRFLAILKSAFAIVPSFNFRIVSVQVFVDSTSNRRFEYREEQVFLYEVNLDREEKLQPYDSDFNQT